ncbi:MAG: glycogen debranching enzyme family protein [Nitrospirae bacterium]|nr:glycogen debranching enzyme family protein [Nitrospirota bacterium]
MSTFTATRAVEWEPAIKRDGRRSSRDSSRTWLGARRSVEHEQEWLEADGWGGFAMGTRSGIRTRRYHSLLTVATRPPGGRMNLVSGLEVWIEGPFGTRVLSAHRYAPGTVPPDAGERLERFASDPWPCWVFRLEKSARIEHEVCVPRGLRVVILTWRLRARTRGLTLAVRPLLSGRDIHHLHRENADFDFTPQAGVDSISWRPYTGVPGVIALTNGAYKHDPRWYRNFLYAGEQARGLDYVEDLASPGIFRWPLEDGEAFLVLHPEGVVPGSGPDAGEWVARIKAAERERRRRLGGPLRRAAEAYLVRATSGWSVVAGYPWFSAWGRETFIAFRGLCLATGCLEEARSILLEGSEKARDGLFPGTADEGGQPEHISVDAALWFIIAIHQFLRAAERETRLISDGDRSRLFRAGRAVLDACARGTLHGIRMSPDGLLACGEPGVPLTWMDARAGGQAVTPRIGKPVEVQALWLNALYLATADDPEWRPAFERGCTAFREKYWNESGGYLYDVVDVNHIEGKVDASFRPNQILAVGGLPLMLLDPARARRLVNAVKERLWTRLGLRSLAPGEPHYVGRYEGGAAERDSAYHQGTAWPWLAGPFVEAWVRVNGETVRAKAEARRRFLRPLLDHLNEGGLGHISEIADGDPPHTPRGCPFQAWSVAEALRLDLEVLAAARSTPSGRRIRGRRQVA